MKAVLVFPPLAGISQPYSSLPALAAFVRRSGRHDIALHDANLEFGLQLLSAEGMASTEERLHERLAALHGRGRQRLDDLEYARVLRASLRAPIVRDHVEAAVNDLRRPATYTDLPRLLRARRVIRDAFALHSEACFPASLSVTFLSDENATAGDIECRVRDPLNPFRTFLLDSCIPALERERPQALGISITFPSQILPAVTLAQLARERLPGVPVIIGGQIPSRWATLPDVEDVFGWCDYLVFGEGETTLETLLDALAHARSLDGVPNLLYRDGTRLVRNRQVLEDVDALPPPDYDGLPLEEYLASEPVFLLSTSRGCYWSRCAFCSVSPSMRGGHRRRSVEALARDIAELRAKYEARCIMFGDDCVPPDTLRALPAVLGDTHVSWECQLRFEPTLTPDLLRGLQEAGCRNLVFGLESYSPSVLRAMGKGIEHPQIARVLDDCRQAGIAFNLQLFFGFPGESEDDARATVDFLVQQMRGAATFSVGTFELQRGSRIAADPACFGLQVAARRSLSIRLEHSPVAEHAVAMKALVERELAARMPIADAPLSLDAHTLLFLHCAGPDAMAQQYGDGPLVRRGSDVRSDRSPSDMVLRRRDDQRVTSIPSVVEGRTLLVLYDYDSDRMVELSPLALWVLQRLDGTRSIADLASAAGEGDEVGAETVRGIVHDLATRGLVHRGAGVTGPASSTSPRSGPQPRR